MSVYIYIKRLFDIAASVIALAILCPLLVPIMLLLKITGEGHVFYFQERIGLNNKPFSIWKFATMLKDSPNLGTGTITLRNDPRITPMGGFLRKTKINELPQIINVLLGDMSWVGPRPLDDKAFKAYPEEVQNHIYKVKPGITGIGSIIFRDEEKWMSETSMPVDEFRKAIIAPYKGALELWYHNHQSFMTDLKIALLTALAIVSPSSKLVFTWFNDLPTKPAELS